jgi:lysophospholipase L1-like esterase
MALTIRPDAFWPRRALRSADAALRLRFARIAVAGDSLAAGCPMRQLSLRPFGVLNFAKGGAHLIEIAEQLRDAQSTAARVVVFDGALNDLLGAGASDAQILGDFAHALDAVGEKTRAVFTLMPHVADPAPAARIDVLNAAMMQLCAQNDVVALDLNARISASGRRLPEMTDDGLHFTPRANAIWLEELRKLLRGSLA